MERTNRRKIGRLAPNSNVEGNDECETGSDSISTFTKDAFDVHLDVQGNRDSQARSRLPLSIETDDQSTIIINEEINRGEAYDRRERQKLNTGTRSLGFENSENDVRFSEPPVLKPWDDVSAQRSNRALRELKNEMEEFRTQVRRMNEETSAKQHTRNVDKENMIGDRNVDNIEDVLHMQNMCMNDVIQNRTNINEAGMRRKPNENSNIENEQPVNDRFIRFQNDSGTFESSGDARNMYQSQNEQQNLSRINFQGNSDSSMNGNSREVTHAVNRRGKWILPDKFDGSTPLSLFLGQLDTCARYNGWDLIDKAAHLRVSLKGSAAYIVDDEDNLDASYDQLVDKLKRRFGTQGQTTLYRSQLRTRKRRRDEPLQSLYHEVGRIVVLAYPGKSSEHRDAIAVDAFIDALDDECLELRIRDREPRDLDHALQIALILEANSRAKRNQGTEDVSRRNRDYRARMIQMDDETADNISLVNVDKQVREERLEKRMNTLCETMEKFFAGHTGNAGNSNGIERNNGSSRNVLCYRCGKYGHFANQCDQLMGSTDNGQGSASTEIRTTLKCQKCLLYGHIAKNCRNNGSSDRNNARSDNNTKSNDVRGISEEMLKDNITQPVYLNAWIGQRKVNCLIDTGCHKSVIPKWLAQESKIEPTSCRLLAANGTEIKVNGETEMFVYVGSLSLPTRFAVSESIPEPMLGIDWMRRHGVKLDTSNDSMMIENEVFWLKPYDNQIASGSVIAYVDEEEYAEIIPQNVTYNVNSSRQMWIEDRYELFTDNSEEIYYLPSQKNTECVRGIQEVDVKQNKDESERAKNNSSKETLETEGLCAHLHEELNGIIEELSEFNTIQEIKTVVSKKYYDKNEIGDLKNERRECEVNNTDRMYKTCDMWDTDKENLATQNCGNKIKDLLTRETGDDLIKDIIDVGVRMRVREMSMPQIEDDYELSNFTSKYIPLEYNDHNYNKFIIDYDLEKRNNFIMNCICLIYRTMNVSTESYKGRYRCPRCESDFSRVYDMNNHLIHKHERFAPNVKQGVEYDYKKIDVVIATNEQLEKVMRLMKRPPRKDSDERGGGDRIQSPSFSSSPRGRKQATKDESPQRSKSPVRKSSEFTNTKSSNFDEIEIPGELERSEKMISELNKQKDIIMAQIEQVKARNKESTAALGSNTNEPIVISSGPNLKKTARKPKVVATKDAANRTEEYVPQPVVRMPLLAIKPCKGSVNSTYTPSTKCETVSKPLYDSDVEDDDDLSFSKDISIEIDLPSPKDKRTVIKKTGVQDVPQIQAKNKDVDSKDRPKVNVYRELGADLILSDSDEDTDRQTKGKKTVKDGVVVRSELPVTGGDSVRNTGLFDRLNIVSSEGSTPRDANITTAARRYRYAGESSDSSMTGNQKNKSRGTKRIAVSSSRPNSPEDDVRPAVWVDRLYEFVVEQPKPWNSSRIYLAAVPLFPEVSRRELEAAVVSMVTSCRFMAQQLLESELHGEVTVKDNTTRKVLVLDRESVRMYIKST
jgi:hypothetical protein